MTDNASDNREKEAPGPLGDGGLATEHAAEAAGTGGDGSGFALRIVEPDDPGTILVATAEPPDALYDQIPPCETEEFRAEQAAARREESGVPREAALPVYDGLTEIAAVRLGGLGPSIFFIAGDTACKPGDAVIVEMEEGQAFGTVTALMRMLPAHVETGQGDGVAGGRLRPVSRKATEKDAATAGSNAALSAEAFGYCQDCIRERGLDMKLVDVLVLHDRGKMIFYFTAPARIDFRELVKDLVRRYRTRIELRQIGVRHETQMVGALGNCGMVCCCRRYLRKFAPVAIKMAKEQNVFLNPVKISGICGRLLCCLAYEQEHYDEFYRSCPKLGKKYQTDAGAMRVLRASLFRESVTVLTETGEEAEYSLSDWNGLKPFRPNAVQQQGQPGKKQRQDAGRPVRNGQPAPQEKSGGGREERLAAPDPDDAPLWEAEPLPDSVEPLPFEEAGGIFQEAAMPDDDDDDDGDSIFGLAPKRRLESGGAGVPKGGEQAAGGRREWPGRQGGRRGQRPGP